MKTKAFFLTGIVYYFDAVLTKSLNKVSIENNYISAYIWTWFVMAHTAETFFSTGISTYLRGASSRRPVRATTFFSCVHVWWLIGLSLFDDCCPFCTLKTPMLVLTLRSPAILLSRCTLAVTTYGTASRGPSPALPKAATSAKTGIFAMRSCSTVKSQLAPVLLELTVLAFLALPGPSSPVFVFSASPLLQDFCPVRVWPHARLPTSKYWTSRQRRLCQRPFSVC